VDILNIRDGGERRHGDRRRTPRSGFDRRRARRRSKLRHMLFSGLMMAIPNTVRRVPLIPALAPVLPAYTITTSDDSAIAIPPKLAYASIIEEASERYHVDAALIASVMEAESAFNPFAVSRTGAMGLMQLMPETAAEHGATQPFDPRENIMAGARYLSQLLNRYDGNIRLALAGYNAGPTAVARYGDVPPFPETQRYVRTVRGLLARNSRVRQIGNH
jgi:soluble lytic murein transglycosylase-like protein